MKTLTFKKLASKWFVELDDWDGDINDLEMVNGADLLLEIFAQKLKTDKLTMKVWTQKPDEPCGKLQMIHHDQDGATYQVEHCAFYNSTVWLCNVTKFVFDGSHPGTIYFKIAL